MTPLGTAALALAARGLRVFPCDERQKNPAISDNLRRATTDPNLIKGWWSSRNFNIGIATGAGSDVWALDVDGHDGEATLRLLEAKPGRLPETVEAITGDGQHNYFKWPTGCEIRNAQLRDDVPGLDWRGNGGYAIAPPSIHPSGRRYAWSVDSAGKFADAPEWLIDLVTSKASNVIPITTPEAWRSFIDKPVEGSRRGRAIARLYGHLVRKYVHPLVALDITRMFNQLRCTPPLDDYDVIRIIDDIARREADRREAL